MCCPVMGSRVITCRDASAAMAMVTGKNCSLVAFSNDLSFSLLSLVARVEKNYYMMGFSHKLVPIAINPQMNLENAIQTISRVSTDIILY